MPAESLPRILVVGSSGAGKRTLIQKLCADTIEQPDSGATTWRFSNKYYEASTRLVKVEVPSNPPETSRALDTEGPVEAVVLLHDCTEHRSFLAVKAWAEAEGRDIGKEAAVCLCVANKVKVAIGPRLCRLHYRQGQILSLRLCA